MYFPRPVNEPKTLTTRAREQHPIVGEHLHLRQDLATYTDYLTSSCARGVDFGNNQRRSALVEVYDTARVGIPLETAHSLHRGRKGLRLAAAELSEPYLVMPDSAGENLPHHGDCTPVRRDSTREWRCRSEDLFGGAKPGRCRLEGERR